MTSAVEQPTPSEIFRTMLELKSDLKHNTDTTNRTLEQSIKTNGRVTRLEIDVDGGNGTVGLKQEIREIRDSWIQSKGALRVLIAIAVIVPSAITLWVKDMVSDDNKELIIRLESIEKQVKDYDDWKTDFEQTIQNYDLYFEE